ncbi:MAG: hypothetical protein IKH05_07740 [Bacteroidaceae bacterium]|nr:hypothetical protein [Bacteroidaceae bacterium]
MDYKYIEQLLERYWACETSLQEEHILRTFFQQEEVPAHLMAYKAVFAVQQEQAEPVLGEDFDERMLQKVEGETVKALPFGGAGRGTAWVSGFRPLYQAAGLVALVLTIGIAAQRSFDEGNQSQQTQFAQSDSLTRPADEFVVLPEQQEAAVAAGQDSVNLTR